VSLVRGSVVWVSLEKRRGSEAQKRRPMVVVSNNAANAAATRFSRGVITAVPLTAATKPAYEFQVFVSRSHSGLRADSVAQIEQVRSFDINRVTLTQTQLPDPVMDEVNQALRLHLALW